jgi:glycosyltransferase involved in cell wall biosynthesis
VRVLYVLDIANVSYTFVKELNRIGIEASLLKPVNRPPIQHSDVCADEFVIKLGIKRRFISEARIFRYLLRERKSWDLFHINYLYTYAYMGRLLRLPYVVHAHGSDVRLALSDGMYNGVIHKALKKVAGREALRLLASTPNLIPLIKRLIPGIKVTYLPNPIDFEIFSEARARELSSSFSWLHEGVDTLITMPTSIDFKTKGHDMVLKAVSEVGLRSYRIVAIARGKDLKGFLELAKKLNLWKNVLLLSPVPNDQMPGLYGVSDLVIGAITPNEVFGMTALEAMACGAPTLNTWSEKYYGDTGFITVSYDEGALKRILQDLIDDEGLRKKMAKRQQEWVRENHGSRRVTRGLLEIYEQVL